MSTPPLQIPMTTTTDQKTIGARKPPSMLALFCFGPCAISGYETGDPTEGMCQGFALAVFVLSLLLCPIAGCVSCLCWTPDPQKITGDGTQRTVKNRCLAGFCVGFPAIAFWEYGDFCSTQEDGCVCCAGDAMIGCAAHFVGHILIGVPLDCCYVMCCWQLDARKFRRSPSNHGGGQSLVGAPTQVSNSNLSYGEATMIGMKPVGVAGP